MLTKIKNYLWLTENLATSGQPTEKQLCEIARQGYQIIINLGITKSDYALEDEAGIVKSLGLLYVHIPVLWEQPTIDDLVTFFAIMNVHQKKKIFVHCAANKRVSTFLALYRILEQGWTEEEALIDLHHIWQPVGVWENFFKRGRQLK